MEINYDVVPVAPIRRSLSKFLDVMQHHELGPVLGTDEGDTCYHGEVLCVRTDQRGQGIGKVLGMVFYFKKGPTTRSRFFEGSIRQPFRPSDKRP